jgi:hypothetical protein
MIAKRGEAMAIIESYTSGNCKIYICDDYVVKTEEEKRQILQRLADIYWRDQFEKIQKQAEL